MHIHTKYSIGDVVECGDYVGTIIGAGAFFKIRLEDRESIIEAFEEDVVLARHPKQSCTHLIVSRLRDKGSYEFCPKCGARV